MREYENDDRHWYADRIVDTYKDGGFGIRWYNNEGFFVELFRISGQVKRTYMYTGLNNMQAEAISKIITFGKYTKINSSMIAGITISSRYYFKYKNNYNSYPNSALNDFNELIFLGFSFGFII